MDLNNYQEVFQAISEFYTSRTFTLLNRRLKTIPFMEVIGKSRSETSHSSFLQWLFQNPELQNSVTPPINSLLKLLAIRSSDNSSLVNPNLMDAELCKDIITDSIKIISVSGICEQANSKGRTDIVIIVAYTYRNRESSNPKTLRIVIENKIDAKEGKDQCKKYYDHYHKEVDTDHNIFVFLAPSSPTKISSENFIKITYQDILDMVIEPLMNDNGILSERSQQYIKMFVENITSLRNNKAKKQIAMDKELKSLLSDFYNNNEELILAAIDAAAPDEIKAKVNEGRDYSSYVMTYDVNGKTFQKVINAKSKLAKAFVEAYCQMYPSTSLSDIQKILKPVKDGVISQINKDRTYEIEGKNWYIESGIWGKGHKYFQDLWKLIEGCGITVKEIRDDN